MPTTRHLSVLSPATSDGTVTLTFKSIDTQVPGLFPTPESFSAPVTVHAGDDEPTISAAIYAALNQAFVTNNAVYSGVAVFTTEPFPFSFRTTQIEHINSIWSQGIYDLTVSDSGTGAIVYESGVPIYPTLQEAQDLAAISNIRFVDIKNQALSENQIAMAMETASQQIVSWMDNFYVIAATYFHDQAGNWTRGMTLQYTPVIQTDLINVLGPYIPNYVGSLGATVIQRFTVDYETGVVNFLDFSNFLQLREATDFGNALVMTYLAGYSYVPPVLKRECVRLYQISKDPISIEEMGAASHRVKMRKRAEIYQEIAFNLSAYAP